MVEVSPRPFGAASQSQPRPSRTITVLQIAGTPCCAANDPRPDSRHNDQIDIAILTPPVVAAEMMLPLTFTPCKVLLRSPLAPAVPPCVKTTVWLRSG